MLQPLTSGVSTAMQPRFGTAIKGNSSPIQATPQKQQPSEAQAAQWQAIIDDAKKYPDDPQKQAAAQEASVKIDAMKAKGGGLSTQDLANLTINQQQQEAYTNENLVEQQKRIADALAGSQGQTATQMQLRQNQYQPVAQNTYDPRIPIEGVLSQLNTPQIAPTVQATAAQVAPIPGMNAAQIGNIPLAEKVGIDPMNQANAAQIAAADQAQLRDAQTQLVAALKARQAGTAPSVAQQQFQQSAQQNLQAAMAQAASSRGGNIGLTERTLANTLADTGVQNAQAAALLRAQETQAAEGQLAGVLEGARGQDIGLAITQAQLGQETELANIAQANQAKLAQAQLNQQTVLANLDVNSRKILEQAQLEQQAGIVNTETQRQAAQINAQMQQEVSVLNAQAENARLTEQAKMDLSTAQQKAQMRLAVEQQAAEQRYGVAAQNAQQMAEQQAQVAAQNADIAFQTEQVNASLAADLQRQKQAAVAQYLTMGLTLEQAQFQADQDLEIMKSNERTGIASLKANKDAAAKLAAAQEAANRQALYGNVIGALGTVAAAGVARKNPSGGMQTTPTPGYDPYNPPRDYSNLG